MFSKEELQSIAKLCQKWGVLAITDEIYEHILYDGAKHYAIASFPGMEDLTVTINSLSKTYSVTGWRVGWAIANKELTLPIRKVHDFLTVGSPAPLQRAGVTALKMPDSYYKGLETEYNESREYMLDFTKTERSVSFERIFEVCENRVHAIFLFLSMLELA